MQRPSEAYSARFFECLEESSTRSADAIVPILLDLLRPRSVVDVGCGQGTWLAAFTRNGIEDVLGIDGEWVERGSLEIPRDHFKAADLVGPVPLNRAFDLVVSLEVAEHLPAASADLFVQTLVDLGHVVLFSAAIPQQGGVAHLNEQWPEYWTDRFAAHGYIAVDCLRPRIWNNPAVAWWYAQNILLFVRHDALQCYPKLADAARATDPRRLSLVHPRQYLAAVERINHVYYKPDPARFSVSTLIRVLPKTVLNALLRRIRFTTGPDQRE
jgi:SAM-dependent methyltransferase